MDQLWDDGGVSELEGNLGNTLVKKFYASQEKFYHKVKAKLLSNRKKYMY